MHPPNSDENSLITDQHFGVRNDNPHFLEHYKKFYGKVVLPFIDAYNIDTVICLGDTFDKRRSINFMSLDAAKQMWFDPLRDRNISMHMLVGNHDIYYKNTLRRTPQVSYLENTKTSVSILNLLPLFLIIFLYFFCLGYVTRTEKNPSFVFTESSAPVAMGHLGFNGFEAHPGHVMHNGMDSSMVGKFKKVFSGHYHMKSNRDNIYYLGNPYQLYWNDYGCKRGFHVFDTEISRQLSTGILFDTFQFYYNGGVSVPDDRDLKGTFVKLIVEDKGDYAKFDYQVKTTPRPRTSRSKNY